MNALVYVEQRPGYSLGKKSDEDLQCSPWSWLDDFMQPFSWCSSLVRALEFLNKLFLLGVTYCRLRSICFVIYSRDPLRINSSATLSFFHDSIIWLLLHVHLLELVSKSITLLGRFWIGGGGTHIDRFVPTLFISSFRLQIYCAYNFYTVLR